MSIKTEKFIVEGTNCDSCKYIVESQVKKIKGVKKVKFNLKSEIGEVTYDDEKTDIDQILDSIEEKNYTCYIIDESNQPTNLGSKNKYVGWIASILGIIVAGYFLFNFVANISMPEISKNMSYGLLFVIGLLTGFHCIGMCGGFVVSYTANNARKGLGGKSQYRSHLMYGSGKLISYTFFGAMFGLLGSFIAFTPILRGFVGLLAGIFLVLYGLKMLDIFRVLRNFRIKMPSFIMKKITSKSKHSNALTIGLLNGLMIACGPLQAIYILAAGTGSILEGGKLLFIFALGTLPAMIGFGYFASYVSSKMTQRIVKVSGLIIIVMGLLMLNNGLVLTGTGYDVNSIVTSVSAKNINSLENSNNDRGSNSKSLININEEGFQEIRMNVTRSGWEPNSFTLQKDVPVKWIIDGQEINGCNNAIQVPKYGLEFGIKQGLQTIEFTPDEEGIVRWSCWMGMIPGTFIVTDDGNLGDDELLKEIETTTNTAGTGCGCGGR